MKIDTAFFLPEPPPRFPGVTKLKQEYRTFASDLADCTDLGMLCGLLESNKELLARIEKELPDWWFDALEGLSLKDQIEQKRRELT